MPLIFHQILGGNCTFGDFVWTFVHLFAMLFLVYIQLVVYLFFPLFLCNRFLRRRYKYLLKNKSAELPQEHLQPHYALDHRKTDTKLQISYKKEATERVTKLKKKTSALPGKEILIQNMLPSFDPNYKGKKHVGNITGRPNPTTTLTLHAKRQLYKGKEVIHQNSTPLLNLNQERAYDGISATMHNTTPTFDLNHKETTYSVKQPSIQNRLPSFDLNQISVSI